MSGKKTGSAIPFATWGKKAGYWYIVDGNTFHSWYQSDELKFEELMGLFQEYQNIVLPEAPKAPISPRTQYGRERYSAQLSSYREDLEKYNILKKATEDNQQSVLSRVANEVSQINNTHPIPVRQFIKKENSYPHKQIFSELIFCVYKGVVYKFDRIGYTEEELLLQIMDLEDEERRKFERLKHKFSTAEKEEKESKRPTVPEDVRIAVWRRDEGKCVRCGSRENLEYDHIIPISKGGSNTVRNIELLCERCNREKSADIR
jgi:hypothetical protein